MSFPAIFTIKEFTGRHMLAVIFLFFGTIIAVNLALAWFALNSWTGLTARNGYVASLDYKHHAAEMQKQRDLGWAVRLRLEGGNLKFQFKDAQGKGISGLTITGTAGRPTTESQDMKLKFSTSRPGEYVAMAPSSVGQWFITIKAENDKKQTYRKKYRIVIKAQE